MVKAKLNLILNRIIDQTAVRVVHMNNIYTGYQVQKLVAAEQLGATHI